MARTQYFDSELNKDCYKVQVIRKSSKNQNIVVRKRQDGILSEAEAKRIEVKFMREAEREIIEKENAGLSWSRLVDEFELALRAGGIFVNQLGRKAQEEYIYLLRRFTDSWMKLHVEDIDRAKAWLLLDRIQRDVSVGQGKRLRTSIDALYRWGMLSGRIERSTIIPTEGFKSIRKIDEPLPEILNISEIRKLLSFAYESKHEWYTHWALALYTGMRSGELYALEWSSIDFDNRMIYVHRSWTSKKGFGSTKGRYWRGVPINEELYKFLMELKLKQGNQPSVLERHWQWAKGKQAEVLRQFCVGMGLPSVRFHTLRACFATQLIKDAVPPGVVMKICGWKDIKTMQRYIRLAGIEVKGATDVLQFLPEREAMGRVVSLFDGSEA